MPVYRVELTKSAKKEFDRLPKDFKEKAIEAFHFLPQNPFSEFLSVKKLKGADDLYRLRIGDYRIVYEIRKNILAVVVIKIGHRKDIYRFI